MSSPSETRKLLYKQLILPSSPDVIHDIEAVIDEIKSTLEFKEDVYGNVMVAVTEAVNNAVFHGNKSDLDKKVYVDFEIINSYRLVVRVKDEGPGFDPKELPDPTSPENIANIGGRGVFLMEQLSDELKFLDDGRVSEMIFNI
ncbi:MAG: ATP-binding protein [Bacteroidia bacterium]|nr:ATP-binding protein [Bacteroidia bacterium]